MEIYSHGKILLTSEYAVLNGVTALALPTQKGQSFSVNYTQSRTIVWQSFDVKGEKWIDVVFDFDLTILTQNKGENKTIKTLQDILSTVKALQHNFYKNGVTVTSHLEFDRTWGLGSSSTLFHALGKWLSINPYELLEKTMGGSGYDIAAADAEGAILFNRKGYHPSIKHVSFSPAFKENLFFVHLNQKQNSSKAVADYTKRKAPDTSIKNNLERIGQALLLEEEQAEFNTLLKQHEAIIAELIGIKPIQERTFSDFKGQIKSLGAWGGDFILASGDEKTPTYFREKGYTTVIPYRDFIL